MLKSHTALLIAPLCSVLLFDTCFGQSYSELWGKEGERWTPQSRLPDFSYAGYHCGESPIPRVGKRVNIKSFGAKGDGQHDDTQAFLDAISKTTHQAIYIPPGRYKITQILTIQKSNLVLHGAGPDQTTLVFPTPLNDIKPNWGHTTGGRRTSNYSWSGGMIQVKGSYQSSKLASITSDAKRGDTAITLSATKNIHVNDRIEIRLRDDAEMSLTRYLYSGDPGDIKKIKNGSCTLVVKVVKINNNKITFDRPLRFDIKSEWKPEVRRFAPTTTEVGIENLSFEFPKTPYKGHFTELGYNALSMHNVSDCWVRNIKIRHADSGLFIHGQFCTVDEVTMESQRTPKKNATGHHGVILGGNDNLFTNFHFRTSFIHDVTISSKSVGNVFSNCEGVNLSFDHHRRAPYENLFTNIDIGKGTHLWHSGGGKSLGKHCAARGTFWNIRAQQAQTYPDKGFGPLSINLVGIQTNQPSEKNPTGKWFEAIPPLQLIPQNLHKAQLSRRLKTTSH